ncbi:MAG: TSUP family transporter [Candidatus Nanopelagicales bacterium]
MDLSALLALAVVAVALGAVAQAVTGIGFALVSAPFVIALLGPREGVSVVCVLATLASVLPLLREGRSTRWRDVWLLLAPIAIATPILAWLLSGVQTRVLAAAAGVAILLAVVVLARGVRLRHLTGIPGVVGAGVASAAMNVVGGVGGPPVALYGANAGWSVPESRATLQWLFAFQNAITVAALGWAFPSWELLAGLLVGTVLGTLVAIRLPLAWARTGVLLVSAVGGLALLLGFGS